MGRRGRPARSPSRPRPYPGQPAPQALPEGDSRHRGPHPQSTQRSPMRPRDRGSALPGRLGTLSPVTGLRCEGWAGLSPQQLPNECTPSKDGQRRKCHLWEEGGDTVVSPPACAQPPRRGTAVGPSGDTAQGSRHGPLPDPLIHRTEVALGTPRTLRLQRAPLLVCDVGVTTGSTTPGPGAPRRPSRSLERSECPRVGGSRRGQYVAPVHLRSPRLQVMTLS